MKKFHKVLTAVLAVLCVIFGSITANLLVRTAEVKDTAAKTVFCSLRTLSERFDQVLLSKEYTIRDSEAVLRALYEMDTAVTAAEELYARSIKNGNSFSALADALGSSHFALLNDVPVESVLYDGELDENELAFITELAVDVHYLLIPMYGEDGMNIGHDLSYSDVRASLEKFLEKWGFWSWSSDAPYELLESDVDWARYTD